MFKYTNYCHISDVTMLFRWDHNFHVLKIDFVDLVFALPRHHVRQKFSFR